MKVFSILALSLLLGFINLQGQTYAVTFRVDMSAEVVSPNGVHIAGSFQSAAGLGANWNPGATAIQDVDGDGVYEITVSLPAGTYQYKFINGNAWGMDENPPPSCSVGSTNNREMSVVNSDVLLPAYPFNGCIASFRFAVNMSNQTVAPEGIYVMGDFQQAAGYSDNWDPSATPLQDLNGDGTYELELALPFGDYEFLFVNGNTAAAAESLSGACSVLGANGMSVRSATFAAGSTAPPVYCFQTCTECHPAVVYDFGTHWWNDAVFYEVFVRSFFDDNGDGIGDFRGLIEKLDYLNDGDPNTDDDLGITGIWLMPMMASPSYHGYDVTNYYAVEPDYGTMQDFEEFLDAAHARGIKVIIDLVMNHSSSQHPWFTQSANNQNGYRDWYIWSPNNPGYNGPWGQGVWHQRNGAYFYGLFWDGMPDLNYNHPPVKEEMFDVVKFWLDKGIDGYRLDAIKYLVETDGVLENTSETFSLLEEFNTLYKAENPEALTVGEVWSSTASIVPYVQNDRLDLCFDFDLASAILAAVNNSAPAGLAQHLQTLQSSYPMLQYATFLTNHDIDRVFSTLGSSVDKMKLAASIYLTLPGVPFIYYGEEVGMTGTGAHPNIRRPMQWTNGTHAGFSSSTPWQGIGGNFQSNNVASMDANPNSILRHYKRLIKIRNEQEALRRGQTLPLAHNSNQVFAFARVHEEEAVLVVSNTGTSAATPSLSLAISALPPGQYFVTELLGGQAFGQITIDAEGGFSGFQLPAQSLAPRGTWILLLSAENPVGSYSPASPATQFRIIPNPAQDHFLLLRNNSSILSEQAHIRVFSATGHLIHQQQAPRGDVRIETAHWPAGLYFVQLSDGQAHITERLVLAKP